MCLDQAFGANLFSGGNDIREEQNFEEENSIHDLGCPELGDGLTVVSDDIWVEELSPVDIAQRRPSDDGSQDAHALKLPTGQQMVENSE